LSIEVLNESGVQVDERALAEVARYVLDQMGVSPLVELAISLKDLAEMERLHVQYMDEPGPTDVMAFPQDELNLRGSRGVAHASGNGGGKDDEDEMPTLLGDVVLCPEVAERQGREAGHGTAAELELLTTHGVLHLLGYDHGEAEEHAEMFGLQGELLADWRAGRNPG
jgi:probable rRNA maturation factor